MVGFTPNKGLSLPTVGGDLNAWGTELNNSTGVLDTILGGVVTISVAGNSNVNVTSIQAQFLVQKLTGTLTGNINLVYPAAGGFYIINNASTGAFTITALTSAGGSTGVVVPRGTTAFVYSDGTNIYAGTTSLAGGLTVRGSTAVPLFGYLSGLTLSNDGGSPNSVLDVAAGTATDSTATISILLSAFTKSTGGAWVAGSGSNGMGTGLTVAAGTTYHVFAIINGGASDVYFDTSVSAANAPAGTTAFRRIGSFLTDASAHIGRFYQIGDLFLWATEITTVDTTTFFGSSPIVLATPLGISVTAIIKVAVSSVNAWDLYLTPTFVTGAGAPSLQCSAALTLSGQFQIQTDAASSITVLANVSTLNLLEVTTSGWIDTRGK